MELRYAQLISVVSDKMTQSQNCLSLTVRGEHDEMSPKKCTSFQQIAHWSCTFQLLKKFDLSPLTWKHFYYARAVQHCIQSTSLGWCDVKLMYWCNSISCLVFNSRYHLKKYLFFKFGDCILFRLPLSVKLHYHDNVVLRKKLWNIDGLLWQCH